MNNLWRENTSSRLSSGDLILKAIGNVASLIANSFFELVGLPIITLQSESLLRISAISGVNDSHVIFRSSENCDQWEARADGSGVVGSGLLVGSGGSIVANQDVSFDVDNTELTNGDKAYPIDIFGHSVAGWSSRQ
jgi:hypothetical protein